MNEPRFDRRCGWLLTIILNALFGIQWCRMQKRRVTKRTLRTRLGL